MQYHGVGERIACQLRRLATFVSAEVYGGLSQIRSTFFMNLGSRTWHEQVAVLTIDTKVTPSHPRRVARLDEKVLFPMVHVPKAERAEMVSAGPIIVEWHPYPVSGACTRRCKLASPQKVHCVHGHSTSAAAKARRCAPRLPSSSAPSATHHSPPFR